MANWKTRAAETALGGLMAAAIGTASVQDARGPEELLAAGGEVGRPGGALTVAAQADPKTFNPVTAADAPSKDVIWRLNADLVHINRATSQLEPALATSWTRSPDGLHYIVRLRRGIRFSDGSPFDADDVVFSFETYLDPKASSPQRDLLMVGGKPIGVRKTDPYTVVFDLAAPYAAAERLFDSLAILPSRRLSRARQDGRIPEAWGVDAHPADVVGLGPFRLREYRPGERVVLERNPYYWKRDAAGTRLPYFDRVTWVIVPVEASQVIRFRSGEINVLNRLSPESAAALLSGADTRAAVRDLGAGLEYNFLFFNLSGAHVTLPPDLRAKQRWFADERFRQAVSLAIDRASIARLVYRGHASPLRGHVTPGNRSWINDRIQPSPRSISRARALLAEAGFSWRPDGALVDAARTPVMFSIIAAATNVPLAQTATILQDDLKALGIAVAVSPLEFRALIARVTDTRAYEACILRLGSGDSDPNGDMNVWLSSGSTHLWNLGAPKPETEWEAEIDQLMRQQLTMLDGAKRKRLYDRVQVIVAEHLPIIPLVSPNVIVAASPRLGNLRPAVLDHYTLWNVDQLFWRERGRS